MEDGKPGTLHNILQQLHIIEDAALVIALFILIMLSFSQIVLRNFFYTGIFWGDAALRYLVLWVGLLGAMAATRDDNHITIDIVSRFLSPRLCSGIRIITDSATVIITGALTYASVVFILDELEAGTKAFSCVPTWLAELVFPVAFMIITFRYMIYLSIHIYEAVTGRVKVEESMMEDDLS